MAHLHKKKKNGREYYYIREIARVDGKPKVVNQVYLGTLDKLLKLATDKNVPVIEKIQSREFGSVWLANLIDKRIGLAKIIDDVVDDKSSGPSVGEYFLYAVINRMVEATSKRALPDWFANTAIQEIRPVNLNDLDSDGYWKKWNKVSEEHLREIATRFFTKLAQLRPAESDCFLFDTTNYFTFMASKTESSLAKRGKNKDGRDWLRQIGLALLVNRHNKLPFFYREYEGNKHDSKLFNSVVEEMASSMREIGHKNMTIIFDKGMNSQENISLIDGMDDASFITTYSSFFAEKLIHIDSSKFSPVDSNNNKKLISKGKDDDLLTAYRTTGEFWGKTRTIIVTYNPLTATKQRYVFEGKLAKLQTAIFELHSKVRDGKNGWNKESKVRAAYSKLCGELFLPDDLYNLEFDTSDNKLSMKFHKNHHNIKHHIDRFGKNIIITARDDWDTNEIVKASLDRYLVEQSFRQSKDDELIGMFPMRHWTDPMIRCHFLTCIIALAYLRLIELEFEDKGISMTSAKVMKQMRNLSSCLIWNKKSLDTQRLIEDPNEDQKNILKILGFKVVKGVLQTI